MNKPGQKGLKPGAQRLFTREFTLRLVCLAVEGLLEGFFLAGLLLLIIKK